MLFGGRGIVLDRGRGAWRPGTTLQTLWEEVVHLVLGHRRGGNSRGWCADVFAEIRERDGLVAGRAFNTGKKLGDSAGGWLAGRQHGGGHS